MNDMDLSFRPATNEDIEKIYSWLLDHERRDVHGSFLCNWSLTKKMYGEGKLYVAVSGDEPIAYIWEDFGILEVREDARRRGIGRKLVNYALNRALENGICAASIQCRPTSSIPFWKAMGFDFHSKDEASFVFERSLDTPIDAVPIDIEISFYPEHAKWTPGTPPIKTFSPPAVIDSQETIHLQWRVAAYVNGDIYNGDAMVKVSVGGEVVYFDKVRYQDAVSLGVRRDSGAAYIDAVHIKALHRTSL